MKKPWLLFFYVTTLWANINTASASAYSEAERMMKFPAAPAQNCAAPKKNSCADEKRSNPACEFKYPPFARKNNVEGDLEVEFTADQQGIYKNARVISRKLTKTSVTDNEGKIIEVTNIFDREAMRWALECRCLSSCPNPAKPITVRVPFSFKLTN